MQPLESRPQAARILTFRKFKRICRLHLNRVPFGQGTFFPVPAPGIPPAQEPNPDPVDELLRSLDGRRSTAGRHQAIHRGPKTSVILGQASQGLSLPDAADDGTRSCPQPHGRCSSLGLELGLAPLERPPRRGGEVDPAGATLVGVDRAQAATRNRVTPGGRLAGVAAGPRGPSPTP
jgi:hypothetical protein